MATLGSKQDLEDILTYGEPVGEVEGLRLTEKDAEEFKKMFEAFLEEEEKEEEKKPSFLKKLFSKWFK